MKNSSLIVCLIALALPGQILVNAQVPTAGLTLWLKGDAGVTLEGATVSSWADQSGQGHDAVQSTAASQPTLVTSGTGLPAVRFDGANDSLGFNVPINGLDGMSIFLVANNSSATQNGGTAYSDSPAIFWNETASWGWVFLGTFQTNVNWRFGTTTAGNNCRYGPRSLGSAYSLTTLIKNADTETLYVDRNEALRLEFKNYPLAGVADNGYLGRGFSTYYAGEILEVLVYTQALSDTDRQTVEAYLFNKYLANQRPTVSILSPANFATFDAPASITVSADAADDGAIAQVDFFANGLLIGTANSFPYSITWNNVSGGAYGLTAKATDTAGAWTVSERVVVRVNYATPEEGPVLSGLGLWFKADAGITAEGQGVAVWADQSGFDRNAVQPVAASQPTLVTGGNGKPAVNFDGVTSHMIFPMPMNGLSSLTMAVVVNNTSPQTTGAAGEGYAVMYWNEPAGSSWGGLSLGVFQDSVNWRIGTQVSQSGSPNYPGPAHPRPASLVRNYSRTVVVKEADTEMLYTNGILAATVGGKATTTAGINENAGNMGRGYFSGVFTYFRGEIQEILVYTNALSATDLENLDTYLHAKYWSAAQPTVTITTPGANTAFTAPASFAITADPAASGGTISKVEFFDNGAPIGTVSSPPWSISLNNATQGGHMLTAKVTDDAGLFNYSLPVFVFGNAASGFALVDNFEDRSLAPIIFQGNWSGAFPDDTVRLDPTTFAGGNPSNKVLRLAKANQSLSIPALIPQGATATLFFRASSTTWDRDDVSFGFSDQRSFGYASVNDYEVQGRRFTGSSLANPYLSVRDGATLYNSSQAFNSDVWYKIWMVVDNSADTWKMYLQGGAYAVPTLMDYGGVTTFSFYHGAAANDLIRFFIWTPQQGVFNGANGGLWMDDIYLAVGENLGDPSLPPPPTLRVILSGSNIIVSWPASATGYVLDSNPGLSPTDWLEVMEPPVTVGAEQTVTLPLDPGMRFFRLRK